jgi:hypothetical protein
MFISDLPPNPSARKSENGDCARPNQRMQLSGRGGHGVDLTLLLTLLFRGDHRGREWSGGTVEGA